MTFDRPILVVESQNALLRRAVLRRTHDDGYIMSWSVSNRTNSAVHVRFLDGRFAPLRSDVVIKVASPWVAADIASMPGGGLAITWNDQDLIMLGTMSSANALLETQALAKS